MPFTSESPHINRKGRPVGKNSWAGLLREICDEEITYENRQITRKEAICRVLIDKAMEGEHWAINTLFDRVMGKPTQSMDVTSNHEPISKIEMVIVKPNGEKVPLDKESLPSQN